MQYRVTLPASSGYQARSHWGIGTFLAGEPRTVDLTPEYAESLRAKGYIVEPVEARQEKPKQPAWRKHQTLPENNEED